MTSQPNSMEANTELLNAESVGIRNGNEGETISAFKVCVTLLAFEYVKIFKLKDIQIMDSSSLGGSVCGSTNQFLTIREANSTFRRKFAILLLQLFQGFDVSFEELDKMVSNSMKAAVVDDSRIFSGVADRWRQCLIQMSHNGVGHLMELTVDLERYLTDYPLINRATILAIYFRRFVLSFEKLSFPEVLNLYEKMGRYSNHSNSHHESLLLVDREFTNHMIYAPRNIEEGNKDRLQSELYVAEQLELLENAELYADNPVLLELETNAILHRHPSFVETHFLAYLNCLRVGEFDAARDHLMLSFDEPRYTEKDKNEEVDNRKRFEQQNQAFRFAALSLAGLYFHFNHSDEALCALREATITAQQANDLVCLQHALSWLYRINGEIGDRRLLMERCIEMSSSLKLGQLTSRAVQSFASFSFIKGDSPGSVLGYMSYSDESDCHGSLVAQIASSFALKSVFWSQYGRSHMALTNSLLLLNLHSANPERRHYYWSGEPTALATCNVAQYLFERGNFDEASLVLDLARTLYPSHSSLYGSIIVRTKLRLDFQKALYSNLWSQAEQAISGLRHLEPHTTKFLQLELSLYKQCSDEALIVFDTIYENFSNLVVSSQVNLLLFQAQLYYLTDNVSASVDPLSRAKALCKRHHMRYLDALASLYIAHTQFLLGIPLLGLKMAKDGLNVVLAHGGCFDIGRAHLLLAKCLLASSNKCKHALREKEFFVVALRHLKCSLESFKKIGVHQRVRDLLYIIARLLNAMGLEKQRNEVATELRNYSQQYDLINWPSLLAKMF